MMALKVWPTNLNISKLHVMFADSSIEMLTPEDFRGFQLLSSLALSEVYSRGWINRINLTVAVICG